MIIRFKQAEEDIHAFSEYHYWYAPEQGNYRLRTYVVLPAIALIFLTIETFRTDPSTRVSYALNLGFVVGVLILLYTFKIKQFKISSLRHNTLKLLQQSKNEEMFGDKEFQFEPDKIYVSTIHSKAEMTWASIEKVRMNEHYYFLYQNALMAIVIPKAAVQDEQAFNLLLKSKDYHLWEQ